MINMEFNLLIQGTLMMNSNSQEVEKERKNSLMVEFGFIMVYGFKMRLMEMVYVNYLEKKMDLLDWRNLEIGKTAFSKAKLLMKGLISLEVQVLKKR
jgi:hypothetical protein